MYSGHHIILCVNPVTERQYPASRPMAAGVGSSPPHNPGKDKLKRPDGWIFILFYLFNKHCLTMSELTGKKKRAKRV